MPVNRTLYRGREYTREVVHARGRYSFLANNNPILRHGGRGIQITKRSNVGEYLLTVDGVGSAQDILGIEILPLESDIIFVRLDPTIVVSDPRSIVFKTFNQPPESFDFVMPATMGAPAPGVPEMSVFKVYGPNPVTTSSTVEFVWDSAPAVGAGGIWDLILRHRDNVGVQVGANILLTQVTAASNWNAAFTGRNTNAGAINLLEDETLTMELLRQAGADTDTPRIYGRGVTQPNPVNIGTTPNIIDCYVHVIIGNAQTD